MTRKSFVVTVLQPEDVSTRELQGYIRDAVSQWAGQWEPPGAYGEDTPGDPIFEINGSRVTVRPLTGTK